MSEELRLVATPHRAIYPALSSPQQVYVLIEVLPSSPALEAEAPPVNLCLVLDRSGSMAGAKLRAMKAAAKQVVDRLGPQDRLAVVAHKLQTQALDEAAAGDAARATQRWRAASTRLLELGEVEMAQQTRQQAEQLEQNGQLDLAAYQKMRYATKQLTETDFHHDKP